jgi:hypothetical protein
MTGAHNNRENLSFTGRTMLYGLTTTRHLKPPLRWLYNSDFHCLFTRAWVAVIGTILTGITGLSWKRLVISVSNYPMLDCVCFFIFPKTLSPPGHYPAYCNAAQR